MADAPTGRNSRLRLCLPIGHVPRGPIIFSVIQPTVLVCDDEAPLRQLVCAALEDSDCSIVEASDGDQALALAQRLHPDVIVLDMMMPGRSGLEVVTALRADSSFVETPVVFLTARAQTTDRKAAAAAGADHFLSKPFSVVELASLVEKLLGGSQ